MFKPKTLIFSSILLIVFASFIFAPQAKAYINWGPKYKGSDSYYWGSDWYNSKRNGLGDMVALYYFNGNPPLDQGTIGTLDNLFGYQGIYNN